MNPSTRVPKAKAILQSTRSSSLKGAGDTDLLARAGPTMLNLHQVAGFDGRCEGVDRNRVRLCRKAAAWFALLTLGESLLCHESGARELLGRQGFERYSFRLFEDSM